MFVVSTGNVTHTPTPPPPLLSSELGILPGEILSLFRWRDRTSAVQGYGCSPETGDCNLHVGGKNEMCALSLRNETWWCWTTCMALTVQYFCRDQDSLAVCEVLVVLSYLRALGFVQSCNYTWHQIGNCSSVLQFSMVKRSGSKQYKIRDGWSSLFLVPFGKKKALNIF